MTDDGVVGITPTRPPRENADPASAPIPSVTVNGRRASLDGVPAWTSALDWLRSRGLTGAKEGCAEGECGACSVLVARPGTPAGLEPGPESPTEWAAVNACLVPAAALDGQEVVTAEGLGTSTDLHPVQHELAVRGGSQCGYCTPGFVCSLAAEYYRPGRTDGTRVDPHALGGNLCRCTGYRPILDAAHALGAPPADDPHAARLHRPPPQPAATRLVTADGTFVRATTLDEALAELAAHPEARVVAGSTDWGVEVNLRGERAPYVVAVDRVPQLRELEVTDDEVRIGAALTLSEVERRVGPHVPLLAGMLPQFASRLIRNAATLGGNLATASPIGDAAPALLALDARLVLSAPGGDREVPLTEFFTGYRETALRPGELVRAVVVPRPTPALAAFHKITKRRYDDISSVAVALALDVADGVVTRAAIGLGGVAATPLRARATEAALLGRPWDDATARRAAEVLAGEGTPLDDHRASAAYRSAMLGRSLLRFHHETTREDG